jgi:macrolide phosphotransferase
MVALGAGMDYVAYELDGQTIVRVPRHADVQAYLPVEYALLRRLHRSMPLRIPLPTILGLPGLKLRYGFIGYRKIDGTSALQSPQRPGRVIARQLGRLLTCLHGISRETLTRIGVRTVPAEEALGQAVAQARTDMSYLAKRHISVPLGPCRQYLASLTRNPLAPGKRAVLTHGDLYPEHILLDGQGGRIAGVIDWADSALTDPSIDLAGAFYWGGAAFAQRVMDYTDGKFDVGSLERAGFYAFCRALSDVRYGSQPNNAAYLRAAISFLEGREYAWRARAYRA